MGTSEMCQPDGEFPGAMTRRDSPALLPSSQTALPRAAVSKFKHNKAVFYFHSAFHPKNSEDFVDILAFVFTSPHEKQVGTSVIFPL